MTFETKITQSEFVPVTTGTFSGVIIDSDTGKGVPFATVQIISPQGKYTGLPATVADKDGYFEISGPSVLPPNSIMFTSAGYKSVIWALESMEEANAVVTMDRDVKEIDPVVIKSTKKDNTALLFIAAALLFLMMRKKKKSVSGVGFNMNTLLIIGAGIVMFKGFDIINQILIMLGLSKSKDERDVEDEETNTNSPLNSDLFKAAPLSVKDQLKKEWVDSGKFQDFTTTLKFYTFTPFYDDVAIVHGILSQMPSQVVSSYFAYGWEQLEGNLIDWLRGGIWPMDRLSSSELNDIIELLKKKPKGY
jgi:hypothetical protein